MASNKQQTDRNQKINLKLGNSKDLMILMLSCDKRKK